MQMIMNKNVAWFVFLGFALSTYWKMPGTGIAICGASVAIVLVQIKNQNKHAVETAGVSEGDEDDDF